MSKRRVDMSADELNRVRDSDRKYRASVKDSPQYLEKKRASRVKSNNVVVGPFGRTRADVNQLKVKYGLTFEQYDAMLADQDGLCAICRRAETTMKSGRFIGVSVKGDLPKRMAVDHDHQTNKIRGLLCHKCNALIGYAREDILVLEAAIRYLELHNGVANK